MREIINLNQGWKFIRKDVGLPDDISECLKGAWQNVNLPHTWNAVDGMDGNGGYYQGRCWYVKCFDMPRQPLPGGRVYVEILAAGQQAEVYVNGKEAASHEGGYSAFRADITDLCVEGSNLLAVACDNSQKDSVYPQTADFTFYGGLYRGVNLISVPVAHFDLDYYGGIGFKVTAKPTEWGARFELESWIVNADENFTVMYLVEDAKGNEVASVVRPADSTGTVVDIPDAHRWSIDDPYLYTITAVLQRRNEAYDQVSVRVGVREFVCDPQKGFIINGKQIPLRGVSRHQDRLYQGNALTREDHFEDARIIKELGANTIRLAHYQHSQDFYDACDQLGFIVWAEIPFISVFNKDPAAHNNCISQLKELIIQNYSHPSICFWSISNEILIGGISDKLVENHHELNKLAKELDSSRLTTIAHMTMTPVNGPMHGITDVESYNHYFGWYGGKMEDNGPWLDQYHAEHPDICLGLSEYGCEGIITYHSSDPVCQDYSEEYQALYHEYMAKMLDQRPWIWSSYVWNMFDFGCAARNEGGVGGRNNKGLVTMDRKTKKDSYFIYKAYWTKTPMVHICGRRYAQRAGETTEIRVYSNQPQIELFLNGKPVSRQTGSKVFVFTVSLEPGFNVLCARAGTVSESVTLEKVDKEPDIYVLPRKPVNAEGVANWFKLAGDLDLNAPMEFPEGKYNVKDTMETLFKSEKAGSIAAEAIQLVSGINVDPSEGMWNMMKDMALESMMAVAGSSLPKGFLESLNAKLIQIDRK